LETIFRKSGSAKCPWSDASRRRYARRSVSSIGVRLTSSRSPSPSSRASEPSNPSCSRVLQAPSISIPWPSVSGPTMFLQHLSRLVKNCGVSIRGGTFDKHPVDVLAENSLWSHLVQGHPPCADWREHLVCVNHTHCLAPTDDRLGTVNCAPMTVETDVIPTLPSLQPRNELPQSLQIGRTRLRGRSVSSMVTSDSHIP